MKIITIFKRRGFTLVEIIIVMSLVGFLFFTMFGTYASIQKLIRDQSNAAKKNNQALHVIAMITNDLSNLYFEQWNINSSFVGSDSVISGGAEIDTLSFTSKSEYANASTMQTKAFSIKYFGQHDDNTNKTYLFRQEDPFTKSANSNEGVPIPVLDNITNLQFRYSRNGRDWRNEWNSKTFHRAPNFIEVRFKWMEKEGEREVERDEVILVRPYSIYR